MPKHKIKHLQNNPKRGKTQVIIYTPLRDIPDELDLHGHHVEDALEIMDDYLDKAYLYGISPVRIVHGHGMGILRKAIREFLSRHPHVKSFGPAEPYMGGEGATRVILKRSRLK